MRPRYSTAFALLAVVLLPHTAVAADQGRFAGMTALSSPLGPLPVGPGYDPPLPPPRAWIPTQSDPRRNAQRTDPRDADSRRLRLRREDLEADAEQMRSANRGAAIEEAVTRDPRISAGARARSQASTVTTFGEITDSEGGSLGDSNTASGARSAKASAGLSGGSVFGGMNAQGLAGSNR